MSIGKNLQYLRKMYNKMTQEELAEKMQVSRQTISKWELDTVYPEIDKLLELCRIFSCSMDNLVRDELSTSDESYSNIRVEEVEGFRYLRYAVISMMPEDDAMSHVKQWAEHCGISQPELIGWDFPFVSQEQINVFHMHGYTAAWILPTDMVIEDSQAEVITQDKQTYAAITIKNPFLAPFRTIPNAFKTLQSYMQINGLKRNDAHDVITCYERVYSIDGIEYMDVYIAVQ